MTTVSPPSVVMPVAFPPGPPQGQWTYHAYAALPPDGQRYEILEGVLYMAPAPTIVHQRAIGRVFYYLMMHVELMGQGQVLPAPVDVELAATIVVQPDVVVVLPARAAIITSQRLVGAPDLVVEVISPGTAGYDRREKQDAYARAGVAEYWLVDPYAETVEVLTLAQEHYHSLGVFAEDVVLPTQILPSFPVLVTQLFR